ncbi:unnamed protein product [Sphagnum tenellum]
MKQHHATNAEVIFYSYSIGFMYLLAPLAAYGELVEGARYFAKDALQKYGSALVFSVSGYLGMQIVLTFVKTFGAFATVTVTSFRKALTIVLSFIVFSKPFTMQYLYSGLLVLFSIYLNLYAKDHKGFDVRKAILYMLKAAKGWVVKRDLTGESLTIYRKRNENFKSGSIRAALLSSAAIGLAVDEINQSGMLPEGNDLRFVVAETFGRESESILQTARLWRGERERLRGPAGDVPARGEAGRQLQPAP